MSTVCIKVMYFYVLTLFNISHSKSVNYPAVNFNDVMVSCVVEAGT